MNVRIGVVGVVVMALLSATPGATAAPPSTGVQTIARVPTWIAPQLLVSTGRQALIFGTHGTGTTKRNRAAIYDLQRGRWKQTAAPPFRPALLNADAVWTGRELVVVGVLCDNRATPEDEEPHCYPGTLVAGSYDPARDVWRRIAMPESLSAHFPPGNEGYTGQSIGALGGKALFSISGEVWSLDARVERWEHVPVASPYTICIAGQQLLTQSSSAISLVDVEAGSTETVPTVPAVDPPGPFVFVCSDDAIYAYTMVLTSAWRYRLDAKVWEELPAPPLPPAFVSTAAWTGRDLLISITIRSRDPVTTTRDGFAFDQATSTWRTTPDAIVMGGTGAQVWSDGSAIQLGYDDLPRVTLQTYRPG